MSGRELLELQRLDDRLDSLRGEVAVLEARLRGSEQLTRALRDRDATQAAQRAAEAAVRAAELDAAAVRDRVRLLDRQLYGGMIRNPAELLTLQRELADVRVRLAAEEDRELELMQTAEDATAASQVAVTALEAVEAARAAAAGPDVDRLDTLRGLLGAVVAERELAASRRPAAELSLYGRVAAHHRPAVVRVSGDACGGCRLPLGMTEVRAVKSGEGIVQCSNCDRVLAP